MNVSGSYMDLYIHLWQCFVNMLFCLLPQSSPFFPICVRFDCSDSYKDVPHRSGSSRAPPLTAQYSYSILVDQKFRLI